MRLGRVVGILLIGFGSFFTWLAYSMLNDVSLTLKIFAAGPGLLGLGIALLIFPGGDITVRESREKAKDPNSIWKEAPKYHRITWGILMITGTIVSEILFKIGM